MLFIVIQKICNLLPLVFLLNVKTFYVSTSWTFSYSVRVIFCSTIFISRKFIQKLKYYCFDYTNASNTSWVGEDIINKIQKYIGNLNLQNLADKRHRMLVHYKYNYISNVVIDYVLQVPNRRRSTAVRFKWFTFVMVA